MTSILSLSRCESELSVTKRDSLVSSDLIMAAGEPINPGTDINVIAEAAGSCLSYDPLFEGGKNQRAGGIRERVRYNDHLLPERNKGSPQNCVCTTDINSLSEREVSSVFISTTKAPFS